jgi:hypothetical protein
MFSPFATGWEASASHIRKAFSFRVFCVVRGLKIFLGL